MPALPAAPNVAAITLRHTLGTDANVINKFHCRFSGTTTEVSLNNWALAISNSWVTELAPMLAGHLILNEVLITDLTSSSSASGSNIANHAGLVGTLGQPANVALVLQYQINRRYRGGRPKQYIAGLPSTSLQDEDHWLVATINSWEAAYTLFMTTVAQFTGGGTTATQIVSLSYVQGHSWEQDVRGNWHRIPIYRPSPVVDIVNGYTVNPIVGTQRRRARS